MPRNVYTLRDVAILTARLNVACRKCGRRGRLHTARLLRAYGPDKPVPDLIRALAGECPRLRSTDIYDRRSATRIIRICRRCSRAVLPRCRTPSAGTTDDRGMDTLVLAVRRTRPGR